MTDAVLIEDTGSNASMTDTVLIEDTGSNASTYL